MKTLLAALCAGFLAMPAAADDPAPYVETTGVGEIMVRPDRVTMTFGVESESRQLDEARNENAKKVRAVLAALKKAGVRDNKIQTRMVQIAPRYRYDKGRRTFEAYTASQSFDVTMDDVEAYGRVFQAALDAGADQAGGIRFDASRREALEAEARARAATNARDKAKDYAEALGKTVGAPLILRETAEGVPEPFMPMAAQTFRAADKVESTVAPGEITIRASVTARFALR